MVGDPLATCVGTSVKGLLAAELGMALGSIDGTSNRAVLGAELSTVVGDSLAACVGPPVGCLLGDANGAAVGRLVGGLVGDSVVGYCEGPCVPTLVGAPVFEIDVGASVGSLVGRSLGDANGAAVGRLVGILVGDSVVGNWEAPCVPELLGAPVLEVDMGASVGFARGCPLGDANGAAVVWFVG